MLSIALIAAALLVALFVSQLLDDDQGERIVSEVKTYSGISPAGGVRPGASTHSHNGPEIVALVLRVPNVDCACEDARKHHDKTFLVADAPKLPFKDCGRVDCACRYERIANRRKGQRRVNANRREEIRFEMKDDRRVGKDRRKTNNVWKQPV